MAIIYPNDLPSEHPAFAPPPGSVLDLDIASRLGLIGLWTVQENAGKTLYDIIGYNNMTTNGSPTWGTSPDNILGSYLQMSGASQWAQISQPKAGLMSILYQPMEWFSQNQAVIGVFISQILEYGDYQLVLDIAALQQEHQQQPLENGIMLDLDQVII
jgi:hypothetical protein